MSIARVRALIVIGVLVVVAMATVIWAIARDDQTGTSRRACGGAAHAATDVPPAKTVKLRIYNATDQDGLATAVAKQFRLAGFTSVTIGNEQNTLESPAEIRYGPAGLGAAQLIRAYVPTADTVQDDKRKNAVVDLVLGDEFSNSVITPADQVKNELDRLGPLELETDEAC